ncbi:MAG: 1-acyl-sn-glycerol-3-phosphate acyltransferase [Gammaproteobacteria bacterium]|nr:1-acyl-sn-glycerol-3-phosphate acyltransferase [Gammaproteobacteria bacterium]
MQRIVTVPGCLLATLILTMLLPGLLLLALLASIWRPCRGAVPTLLFVTGYAWCETIGIVCAAWVWLRFRNQSQAFLDANYRLQYWWAGALKSLAHTLFRLDFEVDGSSALEGAPALVLPRHASIADTVIPMVFYAIPRQIRLRYVLKRELLFDPCLDIVGNRLPNYFVERGGSDTERAAQGVTALVRSIGPSEGVLIYPEGTRSSTGKRRALSERYAQSPAMMEQLKRWPDLLPPRLTGTLALLGANPGRDLLFCAHTGFEGSSHFATLMNGSWLGAKIRIRFWRIPFADIPTSRDAMVDFLFTQWDRMQREVRTLTQSSNASRTSACAAEP